MEYIEAFLPFILMLGFAYIFLGSIFKSVIYLYKTPTFDKYRVKYPDKVKEGKVFCYSCDSDNVYLKHHQQLNFHICKTCGKTLYKSTS